MKLIKVTDYTVYVNPTKKYYWLRLRLENKDIKDVPFHNVVELDGVVDLLRNEHNTFFDDETDNIVIGWEPTGENAP